MTTLQDAFLSQARACASLGSPFMEQLMNLLAENWPSDGALSDRLREFTGDVGASGASLPLRVAGGLHALHLRGVAPDLSAVYPPQQVDDARLWRAVSKAMIAHEAFLLDWVESPPQTNELRRAAVLISGAGQLSARFGLPFRLSELGASGGLNLMFDRYALNTGKQRLSPPDAVLELTPEWQGPELQLAPVEVAERRGVDLNPLNPRNPADALRLIAYLWPDQPERIERTRAAIAAHDATVDRADAAGWIEDRLKQPNPGQLHLIYHTIAWQYFPPETQARARKAIETAGERASENAPLAWLSMEADELDKGAGLTLRLWPGNRAYTLGRVDFHSRWVNWTGPAILT